MIDKVTIVGGGLAGSELALQLSVRGVPVSLVEMRPETSTPAHSTPYLAELVCSNSLKSEHADTASGLLKWELHTLGCRLLEIAEEARVPAGHALAVDRTVFAEKVTRQVEEDPLITLERREQQDLALPPYSVIATGPLTSDSLATAIEEHFSSERLHFYDAIAISVSAESIDDQYVFRASRYGKGGDDYWNIPIGRDDYGAIVDFLKGAPKVEKRDFEEHKCFEACLPAEVLAARGDDALRYGPLKPKGLIDPNTGHEPYAVLQLRQETLDGTIRGLVGFQTRLTRKAQRELLRLIPGLHETEIVRWGSIHRNTFIDSPRLLDGWQMSRKRKGLFFSGQLVGVEGYVESTAHGLITAFNVIHLLEDLEPPLFPRDTMVGALQWHVISGRSPFQPMNANFGLLSPVSERRKADRKKQKSERAIKHLEGFLGTLPRSAW